MNLRYPLELLAASMIWGSSFLFLTLATPEFGPFALIEVRTFTAALVLLPLVMRAGELPLLVQHWKPMLVLGLLGAAIPFPLFAYATLHAASGYVSLLNGTVPIFSALFAYLLLSEKMSLPAVAGVIIGFIGVAILSGDKSSLKGTQDILAIVACLIASLSYALTASFYKKYLNNLNPLVTTTGTQVFAAIVLAPLAFLFWPESTLGTTAWMSAITLGVLCTALAVLIYYDLLNREGIAKTVVVTYLIPVFAILIGFVVLNEPITGTMILGGLLVLMGVGFATGLFSKS